MIDACCGNSVSYRRYHLIAVLQRLSEILSLNCDNNLKCKSLLTSNFITGVSFDFARLTNIKELLRVKIYKMVTISNKSQLLKNVILKLTPRM